MYTSNIKKIISLFLIFCPVLISAKSKKKVIEPEAAVKKLAPLERKAEKPSEGVYYSLFVRSFADSNGDGIGDFNGITKKLDYLNDGNDSTTSDLGITGIWLMPIFPSHTYHGYGVDDYYSVNPDYGTMADFEKMISECKKRGIDVILDITVNHSSAYIDWFVQARDPKSKYRNWYIWTNDDDVKAGKVNLNQKIWGNKIWHKDELYSEKTTDGKDKYYYYAGMFHDSMPDLNMAEPEVQEEFKKIFKFWLDKGVAGFRYDAAGHIYNPVKLFKQDDYFVRTVGFWKDMTSHILSLNPDAFNVAEIWEPTAKRANLLRGMQSVFHFDLGTELISLINSQELADLNGTADEAEESSYNGIVKNLESVYKLYSENNPAYVDAPFLSNHDQVRPAALLRNKLEKMKLAADLYILAEGVPFIYYGEEIAMKSGSNDPSKRTPFVWKANGKDKSQASWSDKPEWGNISAYNKKTLSVFEQQKDPNSLLNHYKRVIRVKTAHPALFKGRLKAVTLKEPSILSWAMECSSEKAFVVHNISSLKTVNIKLPEEYNMPMVYAASPEAKVEDGILTLPAMSSVVLAQK